MLSDMISFVRVLMGDNVNSVAISPDSTVGQSYDDPTITDAINEAVRLYCNLVPCTYIEAAAVAPSASGVISAPSDYFEVKRVSYGGVALVKSNRDFEDLMNASFETTTGASPRRWSWIDSNTILLTPIPASPTTSAVIAYNQIPAPLVYTVQSATLDARIQWNHQEYLKYAAASYLLQLEDDKESHDLAAKFSAEFQNLIGVSK